MEEASARRAALARALPIMQWLPAYDRSRLRGDVIAGAIVAALLIPQSLGYARFAGVPVEVGLYAIPLALLAYAGISSPERSLLRCSFRSPWGTPGLPVCP